MASYDPPGQPGPTGNPIADIERAYEWTAEFFTVRSPLIRVIADINYATIRRLF